MADMTMVAPCDLTSVGFTASDLPSPAGRLRVFRAGTGPGVLLLHGIGGGASSYLWTELAPSLARRSTVIAPDFVGWGDSEHPARYLLFDDYVRQIEALLDHTGPLDAVVAQSLAAGFAIRALGKRPDAASRRLVMLAPTGGRDFGVDSFPWPLRWTLGLLARVPAVNMVLYRAYFHRRETIRSWYERRGFLDRTKVPEAMVEAALRSATQPNAAYSALPFVNGSLRYDIAPLISSIDRPALALWGAQETQIAGSIRERAAALNPDHVETREIAGARTNLESEQPEATAAAIIRFLGEPGATPAAGRVAPLNGAG
jgi:pimeloyl-ACP methyl ester carboxylesterase